MWLDFGMLIESSLVIFNYCIVWCLGEIKCILSLINYSLFWFYFRYYVGRKVMFDSDFKSGLYFIVLYINCGSVLCS